MKDQNKTKQQLIDELEQLRRRVSEYEKMADRRKELENEFRKSDLKFQSIYEESPIGIVLYNSQGELLDANPVYLEIFGVSDVTEIKGFKLFEDPNISDGIKARLAKGETARYESKLDFEKVKELKHYETSKSGTIDLQVMIAPIYKKEDPHPCYYQVQVRDVTENKQAKEMLEVYNRFLEIANRHLDMPPLLKEFVTEVRNYTDCEAVGIRLLDEDGNIPYQEYEGFSQKFYELANSLSIKSDECMCVNVVKGKAESCLPFYTDGGSFYLNGTTSFLATVSGDYKEKTRNICNREGYESVALVPILLSGKVFGLVHIADRRENMVPLEKVLVLESAAKQLGSAISQVIARESLKESEELHRITLSNISDAVFITNDSGNFTYISPNVGIIFGYSNEEVEGLGNIKELLGDKLFNPDGLKVAGELRNIERDILDKDFKSHTLLVNVKRVSIKGGTLLYTCRDITERKRAQREIKRAHDKLEVRVLERTAELSEANAKLARQIIECQMVERESLMLAAAVSHAAEAIMITEPDGIITYVNPAFETMSGYGRGEVIGQNHEILKINRNDEESNKDMWPVPARDEVWRGQLILTGLDGIPYELRVTISPIRDDSGEIVNFVTIMRDVSPEVSLERMVYQKQKMEAVGVLAGGIAHDFNNILGLIIGYMELALDKIDSDGRQIQHCLNQAFNACSRAKELVRQIITFSRDMEIERIPVSLGKHIKEAAKFIRATLPQTIEIRQNIAVESGIVIADPTQIQQMLINLCTNAAQAMQDGKGLIEIGLEELFIEPSDSQRYNNIKPGKYLKLSVSDTGQGIDPSIIDRIFDPYFTTREKVSGSGLGLAVVHGIVTNYGGTITVDSKPGKGATFEIFLPKTETGDEGKSREIQSLPAGNERILFVDDEK